ncbi:MAG: hypothetical protein ACOCSL_04775, partial [Thermoplasmatota archaeon]
DIFGSVYPLPFHVDWLFISLITLVIGLGYYGYTDNKASKLDFPAQTEKAVIYDSKIDRWLKLQNDFIKRSEKDRLILYLLDLIVCQSNLMEEKEALDLLTPLIVYEEERSDLYSLKISRRKSIEENECKRKKILNQVMMNLEEKIRSEEIRIV